MENRYLVITNKGLSSEEIYYCGNIEIEAFKKFKAISFKNKQIVLAKVKYTIIHGFELIERYQIIKRIV
ncbi:hypothetical protein IRP63_15625 (plasmid) [Clostridium botulinum]|uniref:Uncharacterized protein n=1 Tax=Clostridium botulinum C/D str. DC5 TaxID=1443128 RepID=A0A0A0HXC5_CLOBO|nr:hypothetical protein [Clostridium botulinum]KGM92894.1 hypothetical protein Z956_13205 [Clostridium botulinum D str. CCUG 7971]KGM93048.1 hypothetical protein Z955_16095 [Clostridium botulinum C/D str. DC5]KOC47190.1 hypothetical protein ADU88_10825 [Clostridium botulinum]KOC51516.1 hypothetical protein ADU89_13375 [Clostridium botulinum]KOC56018.1 hypothetical protein ADU90_09165 [Clostridium botulinum]